MGNGYYIDLANGPSHKSLAYRLWRALCLCASLTGRYSGYVPKEEDYRFTPWFAWEIAWGIWDDCPCFKCKGVR